MYIKIKSNVASLQNKAKKPNKLISFGKYYSNNISECSLNFKSMLSQDTNKFTCRGGPPLISKAFKITPIHRKVSNSDVEQKPGSVMYPALNSTINIDTNKYMSDDNSMNDRYNSSLFNKQSEPPISINSCSLSGMFRLRTNISRQSNTKS